MVVRMTRTRSVIVLAALIVAVFSVGRATADEQRSSARGSVRYLDVDVSVPNDNQRHILRARCTEGKAVSGSIVSASTAAGWKNIGPTKRGAWMIEGVLPDTGGGPTSAVATVRLACVV